MKKTTALLILLLQLCFNAYSQDEITFKEKYRDSTRYNMVIDKSWHSETTYYGPDDFLMKLRKEGVNNPSDTDYDYTTRLVLRTGPSTDGINYPLTLELVNIEDNNRDWAIPNGTLVYGHGAADKTPSFDSIPLSVTGESRKAIHMARNVFSEFALPFKTLKQGESFTTESTNHTRLNGTILDILTTTTFTFTSVANGVASFDITEEYSAAPGDGQHSFKADGKGSGEIQYDVVNNLNILYQKDTEINITEDLYNGRSLDYVSTMHYKKTVEIPTN